MLDLANRSILLLGYGREGRSTHRYLLDTFPDAQISLADKTAQTPIAEVSRSFFGESYLSHLDEFDVVVRSPGIPYLTEQIQQAKNKGSLITSATKLFFAACPGTIIGISGTKGKSTTASLIAKMLSKKIDDVRLVGNIGNPMLENLDDANTTTCFVVELSSYQLEDLEESPPVAVLLDIVPDHLDHHRGFENYRNAKLNLVRHQDAKSAVFCNKRVRGLFDENRGSGELKEIDDVRFPDTTALLLGPGTRENIAVAASVARHFGVSDEEITSAIAEFEPLPHRLELIATVGGVSFYNDSLATIPEALINALEAIPNVETIIAGGFDRGISYQALGKYLANSPVKNYILFKPTGEKIWREREKHAGEDTDTNVFFPESMDEAVALAAEHTSEEKACVLSPAASSFGMFRDYVERGECFKKAVLAIKKGDSPL